MRPTRIVCALAPLLASPGCYGEFVPPAVEPDGSSSTSGGSTEAPADSGTESITGTVSGSTTTGPRDAARLPPGCHVDILFVVDFSLSMAGFADILLESFFGLTETFPQLLGELGSYNFAITTNSIVPWNEEAYFPEGETPIDCTGIGSLTRPIDAECYDAFDGNPYLTESTDLSTALTCVLDTIAPASLVLEPTLPLTAIESALSPEINARGQCNDGFHDPDDPLIIVVITSSADDSGNTLPAGTAARILDAVDLDASRLAVTVIGGPACECDGGKDGCGVECPARLPGGPPEAPCSLVALTDFVFAADGLDGHVQYTDICEEPTKRFDPFGDFLAQSLSKQADLVCAAAAER